jgi:large subunit ribosomal protein L4
MNGENVGQIDLSDEVFGIEVNEAAMHQVVKMQLANKRQGTQSTLTRSEVRGGGAKPWRQKGTGRARHGTTRSPIWIKGGVVFAPKPRDYSYTIPKKIKRLAMKSALSSKVADEEIIIVEALASEAGKTKEMITALKNLKVQGKALVVVDAQNEMVTRAASNIPGVKLALVNTLNVYDILNCDKFLITKEAVKQVEEVYA